MEIRFQKAAYTLVLVTGLATLVGCEAGGSTVPNSLAPGAPTNTPVPTPRPTATPVPTPRPTATPVPTPTPTPTPAPTKSATVSWTAPLARVDGASASINEIGGYNIYYGTSPTALTKVVRVPDAYTFTYSVGSLAVSTYYFAVSAIDSKGVESALSNIVTRIVK